MTFNSQTVLKFILRKRQMFFNSSHSMLSGQILGASGSLLPFQLPLMVCSSPQRTTTCQTSRPYRGTPWDRPSLTIQCDFGIALSRRYAGGLGLACWQILCFATVSDGPASAGTPSRPQRLKVLEHRPDNPMEKKPTVALMDLDAHTIRFSYGHRVDLA
jgi:hypothetical protein